jgi:hypothetical protein
MGSIVGRDVRVPHATAVDTQSCEAIQPTSGHRRGDGAHAPFRRPIFFERQWRVTTDLRIAPATVDARCSGGVSEY